MDRKTLLKLNHLISSAYECFSFTEFLKLAILQLHELVPYDSGMFFCAISRDCSFFKPYSGGYVERHYQKERFAEKDAYLKQREDEGAGQEALVYRAQDYRSGTVSVPEEPRSSFLSSQEDFQIACLRIVYKGQFLGEIYLHRGKDKPDFSEEDLFLLRLLQVHISIVFHIIHTVTAVSNLETDGGRLAKRGLCLLDGDLSLVSGNVTGLEMLKMPTVFGSSVLFHAKELCEDLLSDTRSSARVLQKSGTFKTAGGNLLADVIYQRSTRQKAGQFFLVMEPEDEHQLLGDYKFKFTKREADIIDGIIQGKNNAQLAASLHLSENTIKTHIQNIYRKMGVKNRTELTYLLMMNQQS